jgi:hypothetical protein
LISTRLNDAVEIGHEVVVDCDCYALHRGGPSGGSASDRYAEGGRHRSTISTSSVAIIAKHS